MTELVCSICSLVKPVSYFVRTGLETFPYCEDCNPFCPDCGDFMS